MSIDQELLQISHKHNGVLIPRDVVEFAKDPNTALHSRFDWDDSSAASKYRLEQARKIIRVRVTYLEDTNTPTRMFYSLPSDRREEGGYRQIDWIMKREDASAELLENAMKEFELWEAKYRHLKEILPIVEAAAKVKAVV